MRVRPTRVALGGAVTLAIRVRSRGARRRSVRLDFRLRSPGAGARINVVTFRIGDFTLDPGTQIDRELSHTFVQRTIRQVRPGRHRFSLLVNGVETEHVEVRVTP